MAEYLLDRVTYCDDHVSVELTDNSVELLTTCEGSRFKTGERKRPVSRMVGSVGTNSLILVDASVDAMVAGAEEGAT